MNQMTEVDPGFYGRAAARLTQRVQKLESENAALRAEPCGSAQVLKERVLRRIAVFAGMTPEDDESWESWYSAAFDMLADEIAAFATGGTSPDSTS